MFSLKECVDKTEKQRTRVKEFMDEEGYFDAGECNIYEGLKRSTQRELSETLRAISLKEMLYTPKGLTSGYLGTAGAQYLAPTWISQKLYLAGAPFDIAPLVSREVIEPHGGECTVPCGPVAAKLVGEGTLPDQTVLSDEVTLSLVKLVVPLRITDEMIEDSDFGLVQWHITAAGPAMARLASEQTLTAMANASEGYGTAPTGAAAAGETLPSHILDMYEEVSRSDPLIEPIPDTMVITTEAYSHSVALDAGAIYFTTGINTTPPAQGFDLKFHMLDTKFSASPALCTGARGTAMTLCVTLVFDRKQAVITGRKNWMRIENYANPKEDLAGAVVSGRHDSATIVDCAIGVLTEA